MPPKAKFSREDIIKGALHIVRENGIEALTARALAERLGSSTQTIFTVFKNMEEVQEEVRKAAMKSFVDCVEEAMHYVPVFKQVGIQMLRFAKEEPRLFQLLFMWEREESRDFAEHSKRLGSLFNVCVEVLQKDYELAQEEAKELFQQVWIFTFGMGVLCATNTRCFSEKEMEELLGREFISMLMYVKAGKLKENTIHPEKRV